MKTKLIFIVCIIFIASINIKAQEYSNKSDRSKKNSELKNKINKAYDVFNSKSYDRLGEFIDENFIDHTPDPGQKQGLDGLKEAFMQLKSGYPDYQFTVNDIIVEGNKATVLFTFMGTNTGEMMGMKATNKQVNVQGLDLLVFKDGKCTEHWGYMDIPKMMDQLGLNNK